MATPRIAGPALLTALTGLAPLAGCDSPPTAPSLLDAGALAPVEASHASAKKIGPEACAFDQSFTLSPGNAYYPLTVDRYWILEGEEDGTPIRLRIEITDGTEDVGGVTTRLLVETEWEYDDDAEEWALVEVSHNFVAGTLDGTICYFGEAVDDYEDGEIVSHEGAWRADEPGHWPGVLMPADPRPGTRFTMEGAPGIAEDEGRIVGMGRVTVPAGTFLETIRLREYNPLDEEKDYKVFAAGIGTVVDGPLALVELFVP